jgi:hypothetical protein
MGQVVVDAAQGEVDRVLALVVHADAYQHLHAQGLERLGYGVGQRFSSNLLPVYGLPDGF